MTIPFASPRLGRSSPRSTTWFAAGIPIATLACVVISLGGSLSRPPVLSASDSERIDSDLDGITDFQESIIGTSPDEYDSDQDGFSDLEEIARNTDPLSPDSCPLGVDVNVGMYASAENGLVFLNSAVFVPAGELLDLSYYFGAVIHGEAVVIPGEAVAQASRKWVYPAAGGAGYVAIIEIGVPEWMIHVAGQVGFFAGATTGDPRDPETTKVVSTTTLASVSNTIMTIEPLPTPDDGGDGSDDGSDGGGQVGGGVWYKPLAADDDIPSELTSGEVCVQTVQFVASIGANDVYEVHSAECSEMDSYCSGSSCSASVGQPLELPNPGAILGD